MSELLKAPFEMFGKTKDVEVRVYREGRRTHETEWDISSWMERGEDWYAFDSPQWRGKRVRIVTPEMWRNA